MEIRKSEALDLLRKWSSERALLRCEFSFTAFNIVLRGRISLANAEREVRLVADDASAEAGIFITPDIWDFDYVDYRELAGEATYGSVLVFTPKRGERATPARIGLLEIRERTSGPGETPLP
jgi:hypothetical protein